jgi:hypothetical protein
MSRTARRQSARIAAEPCAFSLTLFITQRDCRLSGSHGRRQSTRPELAHLSADAHESRLRVPLG